MSIFHHVVSFRSHHIFVHLTNQQSIYIHCLEYKPIKYMALMTKEDN